MSLVKDPGSIRLAMLGMVEGNGHPYSWSAIINGGYDTQAMSECSYPVISEYLGAQPPGALGIEGASVTHGWCDKPEDSQRVAKAALIPNIVEKPEDVIGQVDAVVIPTDKGSEHLDRAAPFIEAGLPLFIDKPLTDREDHLQQFAKWHRQGKPIMSTSCRRYAKEFVECRRRISEGSEVGELRVITITTCKSWERYGIHALEAVYPFLSPGGWVCVANTGSERANIVHARHQSGVDVVLMAVADMYGAFGHLNAYGTQGLLTAKFEDTFYAFKTQLEQFVKYLRRGSLPFVFDETVELMKIIIAGIRSREESGRTVMLEEISA